MAIVTMKRLRLIGMRADREALMERLQQLGCVEVDELPAPEDDPVWAELVRPEGEGLASAKNREELGRQALELLKKFGGVKIGGFSPRPVVSREQFFDEQAYLRTGEVVDNICAAQWGLTALETEAAKLQAQRQMLEPWLELEVPLDISSTETVTVLLGTLPASVVPEELSQELGELCSLTAVGGSRGFWQVFFLCHKSVEEQSLEILQKHGFSRTVFREMTGTAAENDQRLARELEENGKKAEKTRELLAGFAGYAQDVQLYVDRAGQKVRKEEAKIRLMDTGESFCLAGWFPKEDEERLAAELEKWTCAWESEEPDPEEYDQVPVKLKNNRLTAPLNMVTEMYALPAYDGVDPNPLMAPFFILFYGMMLADMGYGILMIIASVVIMKKLKPNGPTMRYMVPLAGLCGVSAFFWGALTGGFFGDFIPQLLKLLNPESTFALPALFSPLDDALMVLLGSLALGLVQIFTGMAVSIYQKVKRGQVMSAICGEVAWYAVFLCIGVGAVTGQWKYALLTALAIILLTQGYGKKGVLGKLMGIGGSLYNNITGYFSDILSYSRLMALMLAGAVIAQVFNTLGVITGNLITFLLISMVGNALNLALNLLGCYVHDMRLQCLEYFGRFYEDGGRPFRPLNMETRLVDIGKES